MKNLMCGLCLLNLCIFASSSFAESSVQTAGTHSSLNADAVLAAIESNIKADCMCGGTPEACCKACPKSCHIIKKLGLDFGFDQTGKMTVVPASTPRSSVPAQNL